MKSSLTQALIIAAGCGSRMSPVSLGRPKTLVPLLGRPIIDRVIASLRTVGIADIVVTVGYEGGLVREHLGDGTSLGVSIEYATNTCWPEGNAGSVLAARDLLHGDFLLVMADHLVDERILAALLRAPMSGTILAAVDRRAPDSGATHMLLDGDRVVDIGKQIASWNACDIGVFRCRPEFLDELAALVPAGTGELAAAMREVDMRVLDIGAIEPYVSKLRKPVPPWWVNINTPADLATAERLLVNNASKNASDALAYWVHRPIENALVVPLARWGRMTPNQVSTAVNVLAYTVTGLFAGGLLLAGSLLSFVVGVADGLDGKLARVTQRVSKVGALEHPFDMLYEFSWIVALAWAVHRQVGGPTPLLLAAIAVTLISVYRAIYDQYGKQAGRSLDDAGPFDRHFRRIAGRRNLYNVWILAGVVAGSPLASLWAVAIHAAVTAVVYGGRCVFLLHRLDRQAASAARPSRSVAAAPANPTSSDGQSI